MLGCTFSCCKHLHQWVPALKQYVHVYISAGSWFRSSAVLSCFEYKHYTNAAFIALKHVEADSTIIIYITLTVQIALELSTTLIIVLNYILLPAMPKNVITRY